MKKFLKVFGLLLLGLLFAGASGTVNRGWATNPMYPTGPLYGDEGAVCQANSRECVGDYLYGWPLGSYVGYNGDYDILWAQYLSNIAFWTLMVFAFFWSAHTVYRYYRPIKPHKK